jgi:DNA gyrase subunit A
VFVRPESEAEAHYMLMVTKNGYIKKTALAEYANVRRNGLIAINLQEGDELNWVTPTTGSDDIIMATALARQSGSARRKCARWVATRRV